MASDWMEATANQYINWGNEALESSGVSHRFELADFSPMEPDFNAQVITSQEEILAERWDGWEEWLSDYDNLKCDYKGCYFKNKYGYSEDAVDSSGNSLWNHEHYWWAKRGIKVIKRSLNNGTRFADLRRESKADLIILISTDLDEFPAKINDPDPLIFCEDESDRSFKSCENDDDCSSGDKCGIAGKQIGGDYTGDGWYINCDKEKVRVPAGEGMCVTGGERLLAGAAAAVITGESSSELHKTVSIMRFNDSKGKETFIHELGHLIGLAHNVETDCGYDMDDCDEEHELQNGYVSLEKNVNTIMGYPSTCEEMSDREDSCDEINVFSNPYYHYEGAPMGGGQRVINLLPLVFLRNRGIILKTYMNIGLKKKFM